MKTAQLLLSALMLCVQCAAQTLSPTRSVDWTIVGHVGDFMEPSTVVDFGLAGGVADGVTPNDSLIQAIIDAHSSDSVTIFFPDGDWFFSQSIVLNSNTILRGESTASTKLIFDLGGSGSLIRATGGATSTTADLLVAGTKDDPQIIVDDASPFSPGDHLYLIDNDSSLVTSSWATKSTGQILRVEDIHGDTIELVNPLRRTFPMAKGPWVKRLNLKENIGIENLTIERLDATTAQTHNIYLYYVWNSWVKCIESINCNYSHLNARYCSNIEVTGSYFHHAFDYGGGGKGYGIAFMFATGEGLVYNNSFEHLRHSMLLSQGSNGNVFSYNYSIDPFWVDPILPANSAGDLVLHGDFPYCNLLEGNTVQHIVIDDSHGPNGHYNTFFRNRADLYGLFMNWGNPTNDQNFIGNEITNTGFLMGNYTLSGTGHFEHGNNQKGTIIPSGTTTLPEASLYLSSALPYYASSSFWPPIGVPNSIDSYTIQTEDSYTSGYPSVCSNPIMTAVPPQMESNFRIYPNPVSSLLHIEQQGKTISPITQIDLYGIEGWVRSIPAHYRTISIGDLPEGMYLLKLKFEDGSEQVKKVLHLQH